MGKIFYVIGKSSSGKDTIYRELIEKKELNLKQLILYTTRPIRSGEEDGVEYFFVTESKFNKMKEEGLVIESRAYNTAHGKWIYFTANDGQIALNYKTGYLVTGTIASYVSTKDYYGEENVIVERCTIFGGSFKYDVRKPEQRCFMSLFTGCFRLLSNQMG